MRASWLWICMVIASCDSGRPAATSGSANGSASGSAAPVAPLVKASAPADAAAPPFDLLRLAGAKVAVSSTVANAIYRPRHIADGDLTTAWNSRTGDLVGAWFAVRVPAAAHVSAIQLTVGFTTTGPEGDYFTMNPRIKAVRVTRLGAKATDLGVHALAPDDRGLQTIPLDSPGGDFRVEVTDIVPGTFARWRELCISEIAVLGTLPAGAPSASFDPDVVIGSLDAPPLADPSPSPSETDCEVVGAAPLAVGSAELRVCTLSTEDRGEGFVSHERRATLVATASEISFDLGDWSDGWEWGTQVELDGYLDGPHGTRALLVMMTSDAEGPDVGQPAGGKVAGYVFSGRMWAMTSPLRGPVKRIEIAPDHKSATLTRELPHDPSTPRTSDVVPYVADEVTSTLRFDGAELVEAGR